MKIETKYNVGDLVWYLNYHLQPTSKVVSGLIVVVQQEKIRVRYFVGEGHAMEYMPEEELHRSAAKLW